MSTVTAAPDAVAETIAELVSCASVEMTAHRVEDARALGELLPAGTKVYVNHLPRHTLAETLAALEAVRAAGLEPVPHLAARRVATRAELKDFLQRAVRGAGVQKVLLIGGDDPTQRGPWADSVALLADGALAACGVREVGIAGYPEGHPRIPRAALERAMSEKLALAAAQGLGAYVVTQFSFAPARVVEYCAELAARWPRVPVFVGVAGPTEAATLLRFAHRCGVSASLRALRAQGMGIARLVTHTDPREQLVAVARYCLARTACNVVGAHFFSFGGAAHTASWMNRLIAAAGSG
ncbi:MAG: methylenetetrahydrofolate reductase [Sphingomonadaceae bacterium]